MINTTGSLVTAWYNLLNGNVGVDVYKEDAPEKPDDHFVLIRAEGGSSANTKQSFADETIIITDIVTVFENNIDRSVAESIDNTICGLILPTRQSGLTNPSSVQIQNVKREDFGYLTEEGTKKIYRKISRWAHYVHQTV